MEISKEFKLTIIVTDELESQVIKRALEVFKDTSGLTMCRDYDIPKIAAALHKQMVAALPNDDARTKPMRI